MQYVRRSKYGQKSCDLCGRERIDNSTALAQAPPPLTPPTTASSSDPGSLQIVDTQSKDEWLASKLRGMMVVGLGRSEDRQRHRYAARQEWQGEGIDRRRRRPSRPRRQAGCGGVHRRRRGGPSSTATTCQCRGEPAGELQTVSFGVCAGANSPHHGSAL
jgi:hypothetical protein